MRASDVINAVRRVLNDLDDGQYHWPTNTLVLYLDDAQRELANRRKDLLLETPSELESLNNVSGTSAELKIPEEYRSALMHHVCSSALSEDGSDRANLEHALYHRRMFIEKAG